MLAFALGGLNLVRSLGAGGIRAVVATACADEPATRSRHCAGSVLLPPVAERDAAVQALLHAAEDASPGQAVPLYYGNDDYLDLVQERREALGRRFRFILNDPDVAHALIHKQRFAEFALRRSLPVPRALDWQELARWDSPVLVKPKAKTAWESSAVLAQLLGGAGKARVFASGRDVLANAAAARLREDILLQEYVAGGDRQLWSFHGYADERGELLAWFVGHKIRTWPELTGISSFLELAHNDELERLGRDTVARAGLKGVFKLDFKQDAASGRFCLLEINARYNLWHYLAAANGVNLPRVAYEYLMYGKRPTAARYRCTSRWVDLRADFRAYRELAGRGELGLAGWLWSLARGPKVYSLFSWSDPKPCMHYWLSRLKRIPKLTVRFTRWLFTAS
jgi:predicted ATP-grasp superfamily ATP-dependent carboligase